jgi:hypothetical protein
VLLLVSHLIVRNRIAAVVLTTVLLMTFGETPGWRPGPELLLRFIWAAFVVGALVRFGALTAAVLLYTSQVLAVIPTTFDTSSFLFAQSALVFAAVGLLAGYGFYRSLGAQPVFAGVVLDD